ncbi:hypothetical protein SMACR_03165 [Sordaria macrospora]|uniref:WGS project CABT00000000 data, contig 2.7 n=2 Tax=Sordaria macrospora TaxID=5147 RepID=F7VU18_SORMK|nr:uncharacterized protein SMAC_03165 [Sordaria macrospora k-hell]KAA8635936.1 hypothetical protein SMACR_03165 [Sordaria macrospora]WPJ60740.1 hypothetical protein SMAC4_03165 [Sordaria macrospora]CCC09006.1 unnamed protein product [Sordaria macrospora k-hell]
MVTNTQPSMLKQSPRLELPVELVRMIVDLLSDDMSTLAALAQTCSFFGYECTHNIYEADAESENPIALSWGALTGNLSVMQKAVDYGTSVTQRSYFTCQPGQRKGVFLRELESHTLDMSPTDPATFMRLADMPNGPQTSSERYFWGTPLHFAVLANRPKAALWLIRRNLATLQRGSFGLCSVYGCGEICWHPMLLETYHQSLPMHTAVCYGRKDIAKILLRYGASPTDYQEHNQVKQQAGGFQITALHVAAISGRADLVQLFVEEAGIPVNVTDATGQSPLHYAAMCTLSYPLATIRKLLGLGARLDAQNETDFKFLVRCVFEGRCSVAIELLRLRVCKNLTANHLGILLHAALTPAVLEWVPSFTDVVHAQYDEDSVLLNRALWDASETRNSWFPRANRDSHRAFQEADLDAPIRQELVELLVRRYKVDLNAFLPNIPETPVTILARYNPRFCDMLRCLVELDADIPKVNADGDTAIQCAMKRYTHRLKPWEAVGRMRDWPNNIINDPDSVLRTLVAAWPANQFGTVKKDGVDIWQCVFEVVRQIWKKQDVEAYTDLSSMTLDLTPEREKLYNTVIAKITALRRLFKMEGKMAMVMGQEHEYPDFSGERKHQETACQPS